MRRLNYEHGYRDGRAQDIQQLYGGHPGGQQLPIEIASCGDDMKGTFLRRLKLTIADLLD